MRAFYVLTILILFAACGTGKKVATQNNEPVITFKKTGCRGKCPVYSLEIFESGKISFIGNKHIDKIGKYEKNLSKDEVKHLMDKFEKANFFDFEDKYLSKAMDVPTTFISFSHNGKYKRIQDKKDGPKELKELEKLIVEIVKSSGWKKVE